MKILIAYYTKTGTTARCAAMMRAEFHNHDVDVIDLARETVDFALYDAVILGASIRMGRMDSRLLTLLREQKTVLEGRKVAYFACCGLPQEASEVFARDIPAELLRDAVATMPVGGELLVGAQHGFGNKFLVWMIRRSIKNKQLDDDISEEDKPRFPEIMPDQIARLADAVKQVAMK